MLCSLWLNNSSVVQNRVTHGTACGSESRISFFKIFIKGITGPGSLVNAPQSLRLQPSHSLKNCNPHRANYHYTPLIIKKEMSYIILFDCDAKTFAEGLDESASLIKEHIQERKFAGGLKIADRSIEAINCSRWDAKAESEFHSLRADCLDGLGQELDAKLARVHASFIRKQREKKGL